jgi:hypothetical protein
MKRILLSDQPLGSPQIGLVAGELRLIVPDGQTPLHLVADGTPSGTLVGGSRYVGWLLENRAQGFLFTAQLARAGTSMPNMANPEAAKSVGTLGTYISQCQTGPTPFL